MRLDEVTIDRLRKSFENNIELSGNVSGGSIGYRLYVTAPTGVDLLDTIDALTRERDATLAERDGLKTVAYKWEEKFLARKDELAVAEAAVAAAYRDAGYILDGIHEPFTLDSQYNRVPLTVREVVEIAMKHIRKRTPTDAIRAEKRLVAQAKFDEARYIRNSRLDLDERISLHAAALAAIEKETKDADV